MKNKELSRREFLKVLSLIPPSLILSSVGSESKHIDLAKNPNKLPNILILVLDTLSALNLSTYGYERNTTPNITKFAERANVYHSHYTTSNFTTPGTASILTGTYPWTHKAYHYGGKISQDVADFNIFSLSSSSYYKTAFAQNPWADILLSQLSEKIDTSIKSGKFNLTHSTLFDYIFQSDRMTAYQAIEAFSLRQHSGIPSAPILSTIRETRQRFQRQYYEEIYKDFYPEGLPHILNDSGDTYDLESLFKGIKNLINGLNSPFLTYIHLYPPHGDFMGKYFPTKQFYNKFDDKYFPIEKKAEIFPEEISRQELLNRLKNYDEFIASVDNQFGILLDQVDKDILDSSYIILTSDHGELFERGVQGHTNLYLYEPLIRVPLIISSPGQAARKDYFTNTSNIDLLPTILSLMGTQTPARAEGKILPGFTNEVEKSRSVYSLVSKVVPSRGGPGPFTISLLKDKYKLIYYHAYDPWDDYYELYNLADDPNELINIANSNRNVFKYLNQDLITKLKLI